MSSLVPLLLLFFVPSIKSADTGPFTFIDWYQNSPNFTVPNPLVRMHYGSILVMSCDGIDDIEFRVVSQQMFDECRSIRDRESLLAICKPEKPRVLKRLWKHHYFKGPPMGPGTHFIIPTVSANSTLPPTFFCDTVGKLVLEVLPAASNYTEPVLVASASSRPPYDDNFDNLTLIYERENTTNLSLEEAVGSWSKFRYRQPRLAPDSWDPVDATDAFTELNHESLESYLHVIPLLLPLFTLIFPLCW